MPCELIAEYYQVHLPDNPRRGITRAVSFFSNLHSLGLHTGKSIPLGEQWGLRLEFSVAKIMWAAPLPWKWKNLENWRRFPRW